ncbi:MAG: hypothetical protein ACO1O6_13575 [Bacteroidota bacterium]
MDAKTVKDKILQGMMTEEELARLLAKPHTRKSNFVKTILEGIYRSYAFPTMLKRIMESLLILIVITGTVILSYNNKLDSTITAALLASVLGYLFGKIR